MYVIQLPIYFLYFNSSLTVVLGLALTGAITQFTKLTVGRPRPGSVLLIHSRYRPFIYSS
jgi:hypothetical protein